MSHDKDHDHPAPPEPLPPKAPDPLVSRTRPDRKWPEHPTDDPHEPVDPKPHPGRRLHARPA